MKEATPIKIWARPEDNWSNEYNQFDAYGIQFDGAGDMGVFSVVKGNNPKFKIGESAHYDMKDKGKHPAKITFIDPQYSEQSATPFEPPSNAQINETLELKVRSIVRQKCIESASIYTAQKSVHWETEADKMYDWIMKPEEQEAKEIVNDALTQEFKAAVEADEDDLPF